jgi:hypothetical protein
VRKTLAESLECFPKSIIRLHCVSSITTVPAETVAAPACRLRITEIRQDGGFRVLKLASDRR